MPARCANSAAPRCAEVPLPDEPYDRPSGLALALATSACRSGAGKVGAHHDRVGHEAHHGQRSEIAQRVERVAGHQRRIGDRQDRRKHQRVAVGRLVLDLAHADDAAAAGLVVDDHGLAQVRRHDLADRARHEVGGTAGRERHDDADLLGGKGVGPGARGQRHERECASHGVEMAPGGGGVGGIGVSLGMYRCMRTSFLA
jgi:hypothetical protein